MIFNWQYKEEEPIQVKTFLKQQGVSKGLLAQVKFQGGKIEVNNEETKSIFKLSFNDVVQITVPDDEGTASIDCSDLPIKIVFEDEHFLIVDKPAGVASIPSNVHLKDTMANRVKGYFKRKEYSNKVIHIVTRLDRDTSGLMFFAKHRYAHALIDQELRNKQVIKKYTAIVSGHLKKQHGHIDAPIARTDDSIITRRVHESGKSALTEYWVKEEFEEHSLVDIQLHTGRTHQIRVHFSSIGFPLIGDSLYGGKENDCLQRQALHCREVSFYHPFLKERIILIADYPKDFQIWRSQQIHSLTS
ncbi:RluA family pseudouridine synthase [Desemzia sp. RIT804]|uniref:RluA family pseudouridine synthase n=1 Tax=Desemzia sp. RIT 804 TaxID=2810209 RepID=UPI0019519D6E|nr:RluA family pseudouridine synthase [Desemzia sp. RIT 804]MBM6613465.1 RluA family pseudouridine synthase [Desemzia sp. RIT 804]